ncbi:MAG: ABC transporter ATP-binding protein, partial [Halobacteriales archaeon]
TDDVDVNLLDISGVEAARQADGILEVSCSASRAKAKVIRRLLEAGVDVVDVDSEGVSLEDVFTAYTTGGGDATVGSADRRPPREVAA